MSEEVGDWHGRPLSYWQELWGVPELRAFRRVGSTSDVARAMAEGGAGTGTLVLAAEQTRGRGRRGRRWDAPAGSSLLLSMVLRPAAGGGEAVLSLRLGMAAARAIESVSGLRVGLKWPNDLLVAGRKVGGILCEGSVEGASLRYTIAGLGL
ncbi:MAG: biotin--[acetyl-CoA-carboxylase] ligase, partial [Gemmatimonadota bacterium]